MKNSTMKDPEEAKRRAARMGAKAGAVGAPAANPDGSPAHGHAKAQFVTEARSAAALHTADHLSGPRARDDQEVARAAAQTHAATTRTKESRQRCEVDHANRTARDELDRKALEEGKVSDKPWIRSGRLRHTLSVLVGIVSGVSVGAAVLGASQDSQGIAFGYGAGVGLATVLVGELVGRTLKRWMLNTKRDDEYIGNHRIAVGVAVLGVGALAALVLAVGAIRHTGSEAEAVREANQPTGIELNLPGQPASGSASNGAAEKPETMPSIPWLAFLPLELVLVVAAALLGWDGFNPDGEDRETFEAAESANAAELDAVRKALVSGVGNLFGLVEARSDRDADVQLVNEATIHHAIAEWEVYAHSDELARAGNSPSPFVDRRTEPQRQVATDVNPHPAQVDEPASVYDLVRKRLGQSIQPLGKVTLAGRDTADLSQLVAEVIAAAFQELGRAVGDGEGPTEHSRPWLTSPVGAQPPSDDGPAAVPIPNPDNVDGATVIDLPRALLDDQDAVL